MIDKRLLCTMAIEDAEAAAMYLFQAIETLHGIQKPNLTRTLLACDRVIGMVRRALVEERDKQKNQIEIEHGD